MSLDDLKQLVAQHEQTIGVPDKAFQVADEHNKEKDLQDIPFHQKPAQQFIETLGGSKDPHALLSIQLGNVSDPYVVINDKDVRIKPFGFTESANAKEDSNNDLVITKERIQQYLDSAKLYVNTSIFPEHLYHKSLDLVKLNDESISEEAKYHWQNLATAVVHAQKVDFLGIEKIGKDKKTSTTTYKQGVLSTTRTEFAVDPNTKKLKEVQVDVPLVLLLTTSRLKYEPSRIVHIFDKLFDKETEKGFAQELSNEEGNNDQLRFIEGMYRNLFHTAHVEEKYDYFVAPAAGLGTNGGDPEIYFKALLTVAKEFPNLNIIYHPGKYHAEFDAALEEEKTTNVVKATKDIIVLADRLTKEGKPCALHIPSDANFIYGLCDLGGDWKNPKSKHSLYEKYIASMTTSVINSKGFNPTVFEKSNIKERKLTAPGTELINSTDMHNSEAGEVESTQSQDDTNEKKDESHTQSDATTNDTKSPKTSPKIRSTTIPEPITALSSPTKSEQPIHLKVPTPKTTEHTKVHLKDLISKDHHKEQPVKSHSKDHPEKEQVKSHPVTALPPKVIPVTDKAKPVEENSLEVNSVKEDSIATETKPQAEPATRSPGAFFQPIKEPTPKIATTTSSSFSQEQIEEIHSAIEQLTGEINSCWPYPNKDLKQIKVDALNTLIIYAETMSIEEAIEAVIALHPRVLEGTFSTRTNDLIYSLKPKNDVVMAQM